MSYKFFTIRGFPKSGTTWIQNLLDLHPEIKVRGEYHFYYITKAFDKFSKLDNNEKFSKIAKKYSKNFIEECLTGGLEKDRGVELIGDRSPTNLEPLILKDIPQIYIARDGRDVLVSYVYHQLRVLRATPLSEIKNWEVLYDIYKKFSSLRKKLEIFSKDQNYFEKNPKQLLDDESYTRFLAKKWSDFVCRDLKTIKKIKDGKLSSKVFNLKYENLHENTEELRYRMYRFLGVDVSKAKKLNELTKPGFKKTMNLSHYRKGAVGDWKKYFTDKNLKIFNEEALEELKKLNYEQ